MYVRQTRKLTLFKCLVHLIHIRSRIMTMKGELEVVNDAHSFKLLWKMLKAFDVTIGCQRPAHRLYQCTSFPSGKQIILGDHCT